MNDAIKITASVFSYLGTVTTLSMLLPQLIKIIVTKQTSSLSMSMYIISTGNAFFWFVYGFLTTFVLDNKSAGLPVLISNFFSLITSSIILIMILLANAKIRKIQLNDYLYQRYLEKEQSILNLRFELRKSSNTATKKEMIILTNKLEKEIRDAERKFQKYEILMKKEKLNKEILKIEKQSKKEELAMKKLIEKEMKTKKARELVENIDLETVENNIKDN